MMLWAALYFPHFALDAVLRMHANPHQAIALVCGPVNQRVLLDVNDVAFSHGLRAGQNLNTAWSLLSSFHAIPHNPEVDQQFQQLLLQWSYQFSAMVCADATDCILLEVNASLALFGPLHQLLARLQHDLSTLQVRVQIAVAPSASAASILAKNNRSQQPISILHWPALDIALKPIALMHTTLSAQQQALLAAVGIQTMGRLLALPRDGLTRRLGPDAVRYLDQLRGHAPEVHDYFLPPAFFKQRVEFQFELTQTQSLLFPLRRLLADLAVFLQSRNLGVQQFSLILEHQVDQSALSIGLLSAQNNAGTLFDFCKLKLDSLHVQQTIRALIVHAEQLTEFDPSHKDLFDTHTSMQSFEALRERLRIKLGSESIYQLQNTPDPRPEHSQKRVAQLQSASEIPVFHPTMQRPSWLCARAIPLRDCHIEILSGPERIESGWWDGGDIRRDYYKVRTSTGQIAWAFRPAGDTSALWMLHGWFA
jgi:protein ImuB